MMYIFDNNVDPLTTINHSDRTKLLSECLNNETICCLLLGPTAQMNCMYECARTKINSSYQTRTNLLVVGSITTPFVYKNETDL